MEWGRTGTVRKTGESVFSCSKSFFYLFFGKIVNFSVFWDRIAIGEAKRFFGAHAHRYHSFVRT